MNRLIFVGWFVAVLPAVWELQAAPGRLAILVEDQRLSSACDLLTVELSQRKGLELLERAQISKVRKEQALSASQGQESLRLGQLLGADGVLVLDVVQRGTKTLAVARLAAVKPGVLLDIAYYDFPLVDSGQWSRLIATRFEPLLPKLSVFMPRAFPANLLHP